MWTYRYEGQTVPVFANEKNTKRIFHFYGKNKSHSSLQHWFAASHLRGGAHLEQQEWHRQAPFPGTALSILASRPMALNCVCKHQSVLYLHLFSVQLARCALG